MPSFRPSGAIFGALFLLVLSSCVDSGIVSPDIEVTSPSFAISDGSTGGNDDFYFLPPLAEANPNPVGIFNPLLLPDIQVCEIARSELVGEGGDGSHACSDSGRKFVLDPGELTATSDGSKYQVSWDTDGPETGNIKANSFLLLEVLVADQVLGWIELDPQNPQGPGQSAFDAYAFRIGETIPVKFWLSQEVLCDLSIPYILECITGAVVDQDGADLSLDNEGDKLGVIFFENSLPTSTGGEITVRLERIDRDVFLLATGEECIPGLGGVGVFDAPLFGDCLRITTFPELTEPLAVDALVSICIDPTLLGGVDLTQEQENQLTMVRYDDVEQTWEALRDVAGDCPTPTASLLEVPETGFFKYAALGINAVADFVMPEPLAARDLRLGGLTGSFSRISYALPGQMVPTAGDGTVIQATDDNVVQATINVIDHEGVPVENAVVHFETTDGTLPTLTDVTSDVNGDATISWTVDRSTPGDKVLTATALGLVPTAVPEHTANYFFTDEEVTLTVTAVGPPSALAQDPAGPIVGAVAGEPQTLSVTVTDAAGNLVDGAAVTWTCTPTCTFNGDAGTQNPDGSASIEVATGPDGVATVDWTPTSAGSQVSVASAGATATDATFNAEVVPAAAVEPNPVDTPSNGTAGLALPAPYDPLVITVVDEFGNPRVGDEVTWLAEGPGGASVTTTSTTDSDGTAEFAWSLDQLAGLNTLTVTVTGTSFSQLLTVIGDPGPVVQPTGMGSGQTAEVTATLADPLTVTVTDQFGNPIVGETVTFSTSDPGGAFGTPSTTTNTSGVASTTWTLGTAAIEQTATAMIGTFEVAFTAIGSPGPAAELNEAQSATTGLIGSNIDLSIMVEDDFGNPRSADGVTWEVTGGGGSFASSDDTSDTNGAASATWTLGLVPGLNSATVTVGTITRSFTVIADCSQGWGIASVDGTLGGAEWACAEMRPFEANISGGSTDAEVYWMNDGANLYLAVRVFQASLDNVNDVRFDFDNNGDGVASVGDDAIGYEGEDMLAIDQYLDQKCLNRSQSGCGKDDGSVDVDGAVANDGTWTTFELSHPLVGDPGEDFSVGSGDVLGFFLTLKQGNGAQGNTQWPGFRTYENITIVGPGS